MLHSTERYDFLFTKGTVSRIPKLSCSWIDDDRFLCTAFELRRCLHYRPIENRLRIVLKKEIVPGTIDVVDPSRFALDASVL